MVQPFDLAVQGMKKGDITGPVQTQFGFHIIKLNDTREYVPSLDEMRVELEETLRRSAIETRIGALETEAMVERFDTDFDLQQIRNRALLDE